jgi:hypothetical protein
LVTLFNWQALLSERTNLKIALKHTLPRLWIEKQISDNSLTNEEIYIHIIGRDGEPRNA